MYKPDMKAKMQRGRTESEEEYYVSGTWESLMQGYGDTEWTKSKMIPIKSFI